MDYQGFYNMLAPLLFLFYNNDLADIFQMMLLLLCLQTMFSSW